MALTEQSVIDSINIREDGQMEIRRADKIFKNGVEVAKTYHRHVLVPGDKLTGQNARVSAVAKAVWTPKVVAAHKAEVAAIKNSND